MKLLILLLLALGLPGTRHQSRGAEPPPPDVVAHAGLSPAEAVKFATLPPGFQMHVFAAEPDVVQPIAFCLDHRGRLWAAEGITYPKRRGSPPRSAPGSDGKPTPEQMKDIVGGADRILVFEDTNGDHQFDRRTVFMEGLNLVSGLEYGFGGLWIGAAPYLMFVPIQEGETPKPAGDPRILLDGWNYSADTHETLNTFTWGPDGWLYGCHGVFCPSNVGKPGAPDSERQWCDAAVWRYHPTRHAFEIFAEGTSNPWGVDFDEYGQCWIEACVIPHLWHMIQGGRYERQGGEHYAISRAEIDRNAAYRDQRSGKPVFPFVYENIKTVGDHVHYAGNQGPHAANARSDAAGGGHAHAGMMVYLGESWPARYRGQLFMGNIHGQRLNMDIPERRGSGFVGRHGPDFLNFNDTWSQSLNQLYDQDGSVYVIDWYDKNQCHHNREDGHDRGNGRIYKVVFNNQPATKVDLEKLSDEELVKLVPSKNEWLSRHARRVLQERFSPLRRGMESGVSDSTTGDLSERLVKVHEGLNEIVYGKWSEKLAALSSGQVKESEIAMMVPEDTTARLRGLWGLRSIGVVQTLGLGQIKDEKNAYVRAWLIQMHFEDAQLWSDPKLYVQPRTGSPGDVAAKRLAEVISNEPSPLVRLYAASALQRIRPEQRWDTLKSLVQHAEDATDHNLPFMYWYAAEGSVATDPTRALQLLKDCKIPKVREFIARRLTSLSDAR